MFHCKVDPESAVPLYLQLVEEIKALILSGALMPGQRLPAEREVMMTLELSRGTVRKAYEALAKEGLIRTEIGSGSYVMHHTAPPASINTTDISATEVDLLIDKLFEQQINSSEIRRLFEARMLKRRVPHRMNIAVINCCIESVRILRGLLSTSIDANWMDFSMVTIKDYKNPESMFSTFDFIITSKSHYDIIIGLLPNLTDRILQATMIPDEKTMSEISKYVACDAKIGVLTSTAAFKRLIQSALQNNNISLNAKKFELFKNINLNQLKHFFASRNAIIIPPLHCLEISKAFTGSLLDYNHNGGKIIVFDFVIEESCLRDLIHKISVRRKQVKDSHFYQDKDNDDINLLVAMQREE